MNFMEILKQQKYIDALDYATNNFENLNKKDIKKQELNPIFKIKKSIFNINLLWSHVLRTDLDVPVPTDLPESVANGTWHPL